MREKEVQTAHSHSDQPLTGHLDLQGLYFRSCVDFQCCPRSVLKSTKLINMPPHHSHLNLRPYHANPLRPVILNQVLHLISSHHISLHVHQVTAPAVAPYRPPAPRTTAAQARKAREDADAAALGTSLDEPLIHNTMFGAAPESVRGEATNALHTPQSRTRMA